MRPRQGKTIAKATQPVPAVLALKSSCLITADSCRVRPLMQVAYSVVPEGNPKRKPNSQTQIFEEE